LLLVIEKPESIQVARLLKGPRTPAFGPYIDDIPTCPFEDEDEYDENQ
jgi:hypothetical protein